MSTAGGEPSLVGARRLPEHPASSAAATAAPDHWRHRRVSLRRGESGSIDDLGLLAQGPARRFPHAPPGEQEARNRNTGMRTENGRGLGSARRPRRSFLRSRWRGRVGRVDPSWLWRLPKLGTAFGNLRASSYFAPRAGPRRSNGLTRHAAPACLRGEGGNLGTPAARSRNRSARSSPVRSGSVPCSAFALLFLVSSCDRR